MEKPKKRQASRKPKPDNQAIRNRVNVASWRQRQEQRGKRPFTVWLSGEGAEVLDKFCRKTGKNLSDGLDLLLRSLDLDTISGKKNKAPARKKSHTAQPPVIEDIFDEN